MGQLLEGKESEQDYFMRCFTSCMKVESKADNSCTAHIIESVGKTMFDEAGNFTDGARFLYETGIQARCSSREVPREWAAKLPKYLKRRSSQPRKRTWKS